MSYIPDNQLLGPHITKIIEGIRGFRAAAIGRIRDGTQWDKEHLEEIDQLSLELITYESKLIKLENETR